MISPTFEGDDGDDVWRVQSQYHLGVTYKICASFTKYASCTCKWALQDNFCKHQIVVLLMCINLTTKNIIEYCNTYYGIHCGGFKCMFVDPTYLQLDDGAFTLPGFNRFVMKPKKKFLYLKRGIAHPLSNFGHKQYPSNSLD